MEPLTTLVVMLLAQHKDQEAEQLVGDAGHFASAMDWVSKIIGQSTTFGGPMPDWKRDVAAYSVLAMAQHRLSRSADARAALAKGMDIADTRQTKLENGALDEYWVDWLIAHILLREAQALIQDQADPPSNQAREE